VKCTVAPGSEYFTALASAVCCGEDFIHNAVTNHVEIKRGGFKIQFARIQPAKNENLFHHAGHSTGVSDDGLQLPVAFLRLHLSGKIAEQFA
jgi:hypothetical protein